MRGAHVEAFVRAVAILMTAAALCSCASTDARTHAESATTPATRAIPKSVPTTVESHTPANATRPPETVVVALGDAARYSSLRQLVSGSDLIARATVEELLTAATFGSPPTDWVATPTRLRLTETFHDESDNADASAPIVLQIGGTLDGLTTSYEGQPLLEVGTDILVFAMLAGAPVGQAQADYTVLIAAQIGPDGQLVNGLWSEVAPFLKDLPISDISAAVRSI